MDPDRLGKQIRFILEIDSLKDIFRQTYLVNTNRKENDSVKKGYLKSYPPFIFPGYVYREATKISGYSEGRILRFKYFI